MRYWSCWSSPKLTGISPENWLYERLMTWSSVKFVTLLGITLEKAFDERSRKLRPIGSSPEISPERWFRTRLRIFKPVRFPISDGRIPVSELYCKNMECRSVHLESERGMVFVSWWVCWFLVFVSWWVCWFLVFVWLLRKFWILRWS